MTNFYDLTQQDLARYLEEKYSYPSYRAKQIFNWVYQKQVTDFESMTNLPATDRAQLATEIFFQEPVVKDLQKSQDGTVKYLFEVASGPQIETVLIEQPERKTLCVSSQYGCGMGCKFCQTGTMGFLANLKTADIVGQVLSVKGKADRCVDVFQNLVFMGMGEPLHNYKGVDNALRILCDPDGLAVAPRRITVSSVGLVSAIKKFAKEDLGVNLAVSLNATSDRVREKIMPINKAFNIETLLSALEEFPQSGRKKITIEYVMLAEVNDRDSDLRRLPRLLQKLNCRINLIPYNANTGLDFKPPSRDKVYRWQKELSARGYDTSVRWSKGKDIDAACGQLATNQKSVNA